MNLPHPVFEQNLIRVLTSYTIEKGGPTRRPNLAAGPLGLTTMEKPPRRLGEREQQRSV